MILEWYFLSYRTNQNTQSRTKASRNSLCHGTMLGTTQGCTKGNSKLSRSSRMVRKRRNNFASLKHGRAVVIPNFVRESHGIRMGSSVGLLPLMLRCKIGRRFTWKCSWMEENGWIQQRFVACLSKREASRCQGQTLETLL